jgi:hypothetical protein
VASFRGDFGDCAFDFGDIGGCYDNNTMGVGENDCEALEFELKDGSGGNSIEE